MSQIEFDNYQQIIGVTNLNKTDNVVFLEAMREKSIENLWQVWF